MKILKRFNIVCLVPFTLLLYLFHAIDLNAQNGDEASDSLIFVIGNIYSEISKEPIKARITYEKLPYGDDYGIANSDPSGSYHILLLNNTKYTIVIKAEGFTTFKEDLVLRENQENDSITIRKDFFLTPGGVGQLIRIKNLYFEQGVSEIPESALTEINGIVNMLTENPKMVIQLEGHTDFRGNPKLNHQLSEERVEAIRKYIYNKGIDKKRVKIKAFGGSVPLSKEDSEEARKANRRVEVRVLEN